MPSSFPNWPNEEHNAPNALNGEHPSDERDREDVAAPAMITPASSVDDLREELAVARRRLQYYEGFAPWIEEQMAAVVEKAAEVAGESEREQARLAEEIDHRNAEVDRLRVERDRLHDEAKTIVAEANATAEGLINQANALAQTAIDDANSRAGQIMAEAHRNADSIVSRFRDEASAIVGRALGDLTALEARNTQALHAVAQSHVVESDAQIQREAPNGTDAAGEWENARADESPELGASSTDASRADGPEANEAVPDAGSHAEHATEPTLSDALASPAADATEASMAHPPAANGGGNPKAAAKEASDPAADTGPFQWLRSALAGRDVTPSNGADEDAEDSGAADVGPGEDRFVTRLVIHPAFTQDERRELQRRIATFSGVQHASIRAVEGDLFEVHVTHELFTSMLGSLLAAAGEHIRLIAQHDDSLEIEVTSLDWDREGAEAIRAADG